jgi:phage-related protein
MPKPVFVWLPDLGGKESTKFDVTHIKFGDGYSQRIPNGINGEITNWPLRFSGPHADIIPIRNFLKAMMGKDSFEWTNPFSETGLYIVKEFTYERPEQHPGIGVINAEFERVYEANV